MAQSANVEIPASARSNLTWMALAGWLLVQPARTCWIVFEWVTTHFTHLDAAIVFLALPIIALAAGGAALRREWRRNEALRRDAAGAFAAVRRQYGTICLAAAVFVAVAILTFAVHQLIVG